MDPKLWTRLLKLSISVLKICQKPRSKLLVSFLRLDRLFSSDLESTEQPKLAPIPIDIGFKAPAVLGGDAASVHSETCELCKMAVAKVNEFISNPENDVSSQTICQVSYFLLRAKSWMPWKKCAIICLAIILINARPLLKCTVLN